MSGTMSEFKEIIRGEIPVLVEFYADWYTPCKETLSYLDELKQEYGRTVRFLKVNADNNQEATTKYKVLGVPSFLLFKEGQILWRTQGVLSRFELKQAIEVALLEEEQRQELDK